MAWFDTLTFYNKYLCSEKHKFKINISGLVFSLHKILFELQWQNHVGTCKNEKKNTTTKSSANFLSPEPNGQGLTLNYKTVL